MAAQLFSAMRSFYLNLKLELDCMLSHCRIINRWLDFPRTSQLKTFPLSFSYQVCLFVFTLKILKDKKKNAVKPQPHPVLATTTSDVIEPRGAHVIRYASHHTHKKTYTA